MYSNIVLNIFKSPKNAGRISKPDGIADLYNEDQTSHVEFSLRINDGVIENCQFRAQANPYIVAICATITEMVKGKVATALLLDEQGIKERMGDVQPVDIEFCIDCLKYALQDYREKLDKLGPKKKVADNENSVLEQDQIESVGEINAVSSDKNEEIDKNQDSLSTQVAPNLDDEFDDDFDDDFDEDNDEDLDDDGFDELDLGLFGLKDFKFSKSDDKK